MIPPLTNQQLIQQNQLLQDQLDLLRQEENALDINYKILIKTIDAFSYNPINNTAEKLKNF